MGFPVIEQETLRRGNLGRVKGIGSSHAVVFPGQGSQYPGMADPWVTHPAGRAVLDEATTTIGRDIVRSCHDEKLLGTTEFVQPALLACEVAAFAVLEDLGVSFVGAAGHSLGEFAAVVAAGACDLASMLDVVAIRGRAMQRAGEDRPGTMSALVGVDAARASQLCDEARGDDVLTVANENGSAQTVISGSVEAVERVEAMAAVRRIRAVRLKVAGAFHSPLMEQARAPIVEALSRTRFHALRFPIAENVTGTLVDDPDEVRELLGRQVVSPVRWESCARALVESGATMFVEAGPGDVLTRLAKRVAPGTEAVAVGSPEAAEGFVRSPA